MQRSADVGRTVLTVQGECVPCCSSALVSNLSIQVSNRKITLGAVGHIVHGPLLSWVPCAQDDATRAKPTARALMPISVEVGCPEREGVLAGRQVRADCQPPAECSRCSCRTADEATAQIRRARTASSARFGRTDATCGSQRPGATASPSPLSRPTRRIGTRPPELLQSLEDPKSGDHPYHTSGHCPVVSGSTQVLLSSRRAPGWEIATNLVTMRDCGPFFTRIPITRSGTAT